MKGDSASFGTQAIPQLLIKQAVPASIGILVMSLNILIDTIFVGQWIGANAIAAINVVLPVSFFIAALGMAIGLGGSSIISRSLGNNDIENYRELITFVEDRPGHDRRYAINASKLVTELNWRPSETFETGIRKTVVWYLQNADWIKQVVNGEYRKWIKRQYA